MPPVVELSGAGRGVMRNRRCLLERAAILNMIYKRLNSCQRQIAQLRSISDLMQN